VSKHSRERLWATRDWVLIPGHDRNKIAGTFWRMPTDLRTWRPFMRTGLALVNGRVHEVTVEQAFAGPEAVTPDGK
jgi:hypothetical protein